MKASVRHLVASAISTPFPSFITCPLSVSAILTVEVEGPLMTKVRKSSLIWQTSGLALQISTVHGPLLTTDPDSK